MGADVHWPFGDLIASSLLKKNFDLRADVEPWGTMSTPFTIHSIKCVHTRFARLDGGGIWS